jgi:spore germination protein KA
MFFSKKNKQKDMGADIVFDEKTDKDMALTRENLEHFLGQSSDVVFKDIYINMDKQLCLTLLYIEGMVDDRALNEDIIRPLIKEDRLGRAGSREKMIELIEHGAVHNASHKTSSDINACMNEVINGSVALIFDKEKKAVLFDLKGFEKRAITEPLGENVLKGSKDSFVETLGVNTSLIRRKIRTPNLRITQTIVGRQTKTPVAIVYIEGIADRNIVDEIKKRLDNILIDEVITEGHIEGYIIDSKFSTFPQIAATERPDKFCANLVSGRVGMIVDGLPMTFIIPSTVNQFLQAPEDYSQNFWMSSFVRMMRFILMFITLFLPGLYISIASFHQEMIPIDLALSIAASKEGVPLPAFAEIFIMLIAFEMLLEAGIRLPRAMGQAISIIGALVVGEAAVAAKFVSPAVVIIIASTGIAGFTMPNQDFSNALRLWRLLLVIFTSAAGLFGLTIGAILMLFRMCVIETFGVPYMSPFAGGKWSEFMDTLVRLPLFLNKRRPAELNTKNEKRQK